MKLVQHSNQNATRSKANHWASICLSNGTKPKQRPRSQSRELKKPKSHYQPQYRRKQYVKTDAVYNREAEEQMESLTFNCNNMTHRHEAFVLINIKLPNRNGFHKLRLKIDTGAQGNTLPVSTFRRMFLVWRERFTFIPERGFIFARVKTGQAGTWSLIE